MFGAGLIRLLLIGLAIWLLYKVVRRWMIGSQTKNQVPRQNSTSGQVIDTMVQDPNCGTYLPRGEAIKSYLGGQELYFCSHQCRQEYLKARKQGNKQA